MLARPGTAGYMLSLVFSCTFFMAVSAGMMIINKMVLRSIHLPITVVMIQMAFTVVCLCLVPCGLHFGSLKDVIRWSMTVPWLFAAMLASSMLALRYSSMGAIVVVRNMAPLISLCIEGLVTGEKIEIDTWTLASLLVVLAGVVLYVSHDIAFSAYGMGCMFFNLAFGVRYTPHIPMRQAAQHSRFSAPNRALRHAAILSLQPAACPAQVLERLLQRKMIAVQPVEINKCALPPQLAFAGYFSLQNFVVGVSHPLPPPPPLAKPTLLQYNCTTIAQYMPSHRPPIRIPCTIQYW